MDILYSNTNRMQGFDFFPLLQSLTISLNCGTVWRGKSQRPNSSKVLLEGMKINTAFKGKQEKLGIISTEIGYLFKTMLCYSISASQCDVYESRL